MTYTTLQLEIIREFGRKELSFGCIIKIGSGDITFTVLGNSFKNNDELGYWINKEPVSGESLYGTISKNRNDIEILGHIPHLEDVFSLMTQKMLYWSYRKVYEIEGYSFDKGWEIDVWDNSNLWHIPYNPTLPLLDQSESTLTQLLTLLGK